MKHFMQEQILPDHDAKYEVLRVTEWWKIDEIFNLCANFEPNSQPAASDVLRIIRSEDLVAVTLKKATFACLLLLTDKNKKLIK